MMRLVSAGTLAPMFTGIITAQGTIVSHRKSDFGVRLLIDPGQAHDWSAFPNPGDSVAVNGCCLTHAPRPEDAKGVLAFDVIQESLSKTSLGNLKEGSRVNLELALTPTTAMGGHFVQGHVDSTGKITNIIASQSEWVITTQVPKALADYLVPKGSITVDGVSLTLAAVDSAKHSFSVALIPTTLKVTTLGSAKVGDIVNIECDMLAKTIVHVMKQREASQRKPGITTEALKAAGFAE